MYYIKKGPEPDPLKLLNESETELWVSYYANPPKQRGKEPQGKWRHKEIIDALERDFRKNCGYCGFGLGESEPAKGKSNKQGQVDHFQPKSKRPQLVYSWNNLVWSCYSCNQKKGNHYHPKKEHRMLSPLDEEEMALIVYTQSGRYKVQPSLQDEAKRVADKRFELTVQKTYINAGCHPQRRKNLYGQLKGVLESLLKYKQRMEADEQGDSTLLEHERDLLKELLEFPDYKYLIQKTLDTYLAKYPQLQEYLVKVG